MFLLPPSAQRSQWLQVESRLNQFASDRFHEGSPLFAHGPALYLQHEHTHASQFNFCSVLTWWDVTTGCKVTETRDQLIVYFFTALPTTIHVFLLFAVPPLSYPNVIVLVLPLDGCIVKIWKVQKWKKYLDALLRKKYQHNSIEILHYT